MAFDNKVKVIDVGERKDSYISIWILSWLEKFLKYISKLSDGIFHEKGPVRFGKTIMIRRLASRRIMYSC